MPDNLIRGKQLYKPDVTGIVQEVIDSNQFQLTYQGGTGININNISAISISGTTINFFASAISGDGTGYFSDLFVDGQSVLTAGTAVSATTLSNTGAALNNYINDLSGLAVLKYGDQPVTGSKTFVNNQIFSGSIGVSGTGIFSRLLVGSTPVRLSGQFTDSILFCQHGSTTISQNTTYYIGQFGDLGISTTKDKTFRVPVTGKIKAYSANIYTAGTKPVTTYNVTLGIFDVTNNASAGTLDTLTSTTIYNLTYTGFSNNVLPPITLTPDKYYSISLAVGALGATNATAVRGSYNLYIE